MHACTPSIFLFIQFFWLFNYWTLAIFRRGVTGLEVPPIHKSYKRLIKQAKYKNMTQKG
jgi:hypothetical protein